MKRYIRCEEEFTAGGETFDGYMGAAGWKGKNYDLHLDIKEIAKIVRSQFKKKFPGYKISARISRFSGGQALDVTIWMHLSDLMPKDEFVQKATQSPWNFIGGTSAWVSAPDENGKWQTYDRDDMVYNWSKEQLADFFSRYYDYFVAEYSKSESYYSISYTGANNTIVPLINDEPLKYVQGLIDSFNYDDSNAMVDYFDVNFYDHISYKFD